MGSGGGVSIAVMVLWELCGAFVLEIVGFRVQMQSCACESDGGSRNVVHDACSCMIRCCSSVLSAQRLSGNGFD